MFNYVDIIITVMVLIGFILGFKDGIVRKIIGIIGFVLAVVLSLNYAVSIAGYLAPLLNNEIYLAELVGGFLIFSLVILVFAVLKRVLHPFDKVNRFANQLIGGIVGVIQILYFVSAFLLLLNVFNIPSESTKKDSAMYFTVYKLVPSTIDLIIGDSSEAQDYFKDFIQEGDGTF